MSIPRPPYGQKRSAQRRKLKIILASVAAGLLVLALLCANIFVCVPAWIRWGIVVGSCPDGKPVPSAVLHAYGLRRGRPGHVEVVGRAVYSRGGADDDYRTALRRFDPQAYLVDADGQATLLEPEKKWKKSYKGARRARVVLPQVPDGDYKLRAVLDTPLGEVQAETELPLYAPALVHLATDRPLYKPGQTIMFRAVVLRMADHTPLDGRPGVFTVTDPSGDILLEERVPAGVWGVAAGDFPLADDAQAGTYAVTWCSGEASDTVHLRVEPFTLPRFEVQVKPSRSWYGAGDQPLISGSLRYRSGAPVADARVVLQVLGAGGQSWPPPNDWLDERSVTTDRDGAFELALSPVPDDLQGTVTLPVVLQATDAAGERVAGGSALKLSATPIVATVETELADGLVPDFNNRVYMRITRPDGTPLAGAEVTASRAWDATDPGVTGIADADAVAALQLDPGKPVSVVIPPLPYRPPPPSEQLRVQRVSLQDLFGDDEVSLDERVFLDPWDRDLEACAIYVESGQELFRAGVATGADGAVRRVLVGDAPTERCLAEQLRGQRSLPGKERLYLVSWRIQAAPGATMTTDSDAVPANPEGLSDLRERARLQARPCVADMERSSRFTHRLHWRASEGSRALATRWVPDPKASGIWSAQQRLCVQAAFSDLVLDEAALDDAEGVMRLAVSPDPSRSAPAERTGSVRSAYELKVSASIKGDPIGETKVLIDPGTVPNLRLRAEQPLLRAGDPLQVKLLRGPDFYGSLPEKDTKLHLMQGDDRVAELKYDEKRRIISGQVPKGLHGLLTVEWAGARAVLLVPREEELSVSVEPDSQVYRPGDLARLTLRTAEGERPSEAAVSLFGVDEALSQLAPLLSPDDWGRITIRAKTDRAAFGIFDARALLTGQIAGDNAVLATLQRISQIPPAPAEEEGVTVHGEQRFDPVVPLTETFYQLLSDARRRVAAWEEGAAEGDVMTCKRMVELWGEMLTAREKAGDPVDDAFGRRLELWRLPADLLELTDPRLLVSDARRLPEDVEPWQAYVWEVAR